jgi:hypothetical protein
MEELFPGFKPHGERKEKEVNNKVSALIYSTQKYNIYADLIDFISIFRYGEGAFSWNRNRELYDELLQIMQTSKGEINIMQYFMWDDLRNHLKYMVGKLLQKGLCRVVDTNNHRLITKIKVVEYYDVIAPGTGGGGRQFYIEDENIFNLIDWYT